MHLWGTKNYSISYVAMTKLHYLLNISYVSPAAESQHHTYIHFPMQTLDDLDLIIQSISSIEQSHSELTISYL